MRRSVVRLLLVSSLLVPVAWLTAGQANAGHPIAWKPACKLFKSDPGPRSLVFKVWAFDARVKSRVRAGAVGVWRVGGRRFVVRLPRGPKKVIQDISVKTGRDVHHVKTRLVSCH